MPLGSRIRQVRQTRRLTGKQLAEAAGVSRAMISQIELDRANPSIDTLRKIAQALDVPIAALFDEGAPNGLVVRKHARKTLHVPRSGLTYQLLTPDLNRQIEFILIELEPGQSGSEVPMGHPGEEAVLVIEGQLRLWIGSEEYVLDAGDSIAYSSDIPHRMENGAPGNTVIVSAITPPRF